MILLASGRKSTPDVSQPDDDVHIRRLRWASRRGLLELDLFLAPFAERRLAHLSVAQLQAYEALMREEDTTLLEWLHARATPDDGALAALVQVIRNYQLTGM